MEKVTIQINISNRDEIEQFINSKKGLIDTIKHALGNTPVKSIIGSLNLLEKLEFEPDHIKID